MGNSKKKQDALDFLGIEEKPKTLEELYQEILESMNKKSVDFDALFRFAEKILKPWVQRWCRSETVCAECDADDLMQEIQLRLALKSEVSFFKKKEADGTIREKSQGEFTSWIYRVAFNYSRNFITRLKRKRIPMLELDDPDAPEIANPDDGREEREQEIEQLRQAFAVVLSVDMSIYKVLTWLGMAVTMLDQDETKINANTTLLKQFENGSLWSMYAKILLCGDRIPWLQISDEQDARIRKSLAEADEDGIPFGEKRYSEFFMMNKGERSGKKSVSDWENRMNDKIADKMGKPSPAEKTKKPKKTKQSKKSEKADTDEQAEKRGKNDDESSDN